MLNANCDGDMHISDSPVQPSACPFSAQDLFLFADGGYHRDVRDRVGPVHSHDHVTAALCCGSPPTRSESLNDAVSCCDYMASVMCE